MCRSQQHAQHISLTWKRGVRCWWEWAGVGHTRGVGLPTHSGQTLPPLQVNIIMYISALTKPKGAPHPAVGSYTKYVSSIMKTSLQCYCGNEGTVSHCNSSQQKFIHIPAGQSESATQASSPPPSPQKNKQQQQQILFFPSSSRTHTYIDTPTADLNTHSSSHTSTVF